MGNDLLGKKAEDKIKEWLNRPEDGYCFDRIPDQVTGFYGSSNICDFRLYKYPYCYYIESKATWEDRFDFSMISYNQHVGLLEKSKLPGVTSYVMVLYASHKKAFLFDIRDIHDAESKGIKSLNITKIDKWVVPYKEVKTIPNNRKELLDYDKSDNVL